MRSSNDRTAMWATALLALLLVSSVRLHGQSPPAVVEPLGYTIVGRGLTFANPSFSTIPNGVTHSQDTVISFAGYQYLGYWNAERRLVLARRSFGAPVWEEIVFTDHLITGEDSHDAISIGICPKDGTIHIAFDHHVDDLNYRVSVPRAALNPQVGGWSPSSFGPILDVLDPARGVVTDLTYPRFIPTPSGDLQFVYREFTSGNGRARLVDYDAGTGAWSNDRVFIERTGAYSDPLGGASTARNPYFNRIAYDDQGTLHATWTWRENAAIRYNRDIAYAYSEDGGITWFNGDDVLVANTATGGSISAFSPGVNAIPLGAEWGLLNDQGHVVDGRGRVHVVMFHKDVPDTVVSYGNGSNSHYRHFWRDADRVWRSSSLSTIGNRPKLYADDHGDLILAYKTGSDLALDRATPEADYLDWTTVYVYDGFFGTSAQGDARQEARGLHLTVAMQDQPLTPGRGTTLGVVDVFLPRPDCGAIDGICPSSHELVTERDTFVQGGTHAQETHGTELALSVRHALTEEDEQLAFVRFHLAELLDQGPLTRATLRLHVAASGPDWATEAIAVRRCAFDAWPEATTSWTNRPTPNGSSSFGAGGGATVDVDVTDAVADELAAGGQRISFEIAGAAVGPGVDFHSREAGSAVAPTLLVDQVNTLAPVEDATVRSGSHSGTNYGSADRLILKEDGNVDFDRQAFLKFDLAPLIGTGTIARVHLEVVSPVRGSRGPTTPYVAHAVADDSWSESLVTWNDRPALGVELAAHFGRDAMRWDVTTAVLDALTGDGVLSLGLRSDREGADRIAHLWSREAAVAARRPHLLIRYDDTP